MRIVANSPALPMRDSAISFGSLSARPSATFNSTGKVLGTPGKRNVAAEDSTPGTAATASRMRFTVCPDAFILPVSPHDALIRNVST